MSTVVSYLLGGKFFVFVICLACGKEIQESIHSL
jgi:hypothetical protein